MRVVILPWAGRSAHAGLPARRNPQQLPKHAVAAANNGNKDKAPRANASTPWPSAHTRADGRLTASELNAELSRSPILIRVNVVTGVDPRVVRGLSKYVAPCRVEPTVPPIS